MEDRTCRFAVIAWFSKTLSYTNIRQCLILSYALECKAVKHCNPIGIVVTTGQKIDFTTIQGIASLMTVEGNMTGGGGGKVLIAAEANGRYRLTGFEPRSAPYVFHLPFSRCLYATELLR